VSGSEFTYEVREGATEPVWVEDYVVRGSDGEAVGTVSAVLERGGERLLVVERGLVPVAQDRRVVPWDRVERVDHDALAVWLTIDKVAFEDHAERLDPSLGVEGTDANADAKRIATTPPGEMPAPQADIRGPVDRNTFRLSILCWAGAVFSFLALVVASTATGSARPFLFVFVPLALAAAAAVLGYRAYRQPYERRGTAKP
jgi:hypothetical protein